MLDVNDDAKAGFRRIEVLTGPGRRRRWSAAEKSQIIAETLEPGANVSEIARRWQICPQQVFGWRRESRDEAKRTRVSAEASRPDFVPIVANPVPSVSPPAAPPAATMIEIRIAGAVVRAAASTDPALLTAILRAVRDSASAA
jgi:transposase